MSRMSPTLYRALASTRTVFICSAVHSAWGYSAGASGLAGGPLGLNITNKVRSIGVPELKMQGALAKLAWPGSKILCS